MKIPKDIWASCSKEVSETESTHRHVVTPGQLTTACGSTSTDPTVWRANSTKPKCPSCLRRLSELKQEEPVTTTPTARKTTRKAVPRRAAPPQTGSQLARWMAEQPSVEIVFTKDELGALMNGVDEIEQAIQGQFTLHSAMLVVSTSENNRWQLTHDGRDWTIAQLPEVLTP